MHKIMGKGKTRKRNYGNGKTETELRKEGKRWKNCKRWKSGKKGKRRKKG